MTPGFRRRSASGSVLLLLLLAAAFAAAPVASAQVSGVVTDASTGEPLPGATVRVAGTTVGAATDIDGRYRIVRTPSGPFVLVASFVGFRSDSVAVRAQGVVTQDFALGLEAVEGGEVVVSAQADGQRGAINQQLSSEQIVNVVSADRIREVPDQNVAESIGRLPGVSVQRDAGEGQKVVLRGLSPQYNNVTVNGQRLPATDLENRSVDLSMISQDVLAGIEVYKSLTPDQDGDAIGGTVNLVTRRAPDGLHGRLDVTTGYNGLTGRAGQYRIGGNVSGRTLGDRLGVIVAGTVDRADRSSEQLNAEYQASGFRGEGEDVTPIVVTRNADIGDREEARDRYSLSAIADTDLGRAGSVVLNTFYARTDRDELLFRKRYQPSLGNVANSILDRQRSVDLVSGSLRGEHPLFGFAELTWLGSAASTVNQQPLALSMAFLEPSGLNLDGYDEEAGPRVLPQYAVNDTARVQLNSFQAGSYRAAEREIAAQTDLRIPFQMGSQLSGYFKTGVKFRDLSRERSSEELNNSVGSLSGVINRSFPGLRTASRSRFVLGSNYYDTPRDTPFLSGDFPAPVRFRRDLLHAVYDTLSAAPGRLFESLSARTNDYTADETVSAGYVMARFNIGPRLMVLPGVRYERLSGTYVGVLGDRIQDGTAGPSMGTTSDSTANLRYGAWLPMVQARFLPLDFLDVRVAVTRTLNRPNYSRLLPTRVVNLQGATFRSGNPELRQATAWNYDLSTSLYSRRLGLFSVNGFYKRITDLSYTENSQDLTPGSRFFGFLTNRPVNALRPTDVYGVEFDLQANLQFLPGALSGVVLYANYARIWSETVFPAFEARRGGPPDFEPEVFLTEREGPSPQQSNHVANGSLGYERYGFSGRLSVTYQSAYLDAANDEPELDFYTDAFVRWDLSATQQLGSGLVALASVNNLTGVAETTSVGATGLVGNQELFGRSAAVGLRYSF